MEQPPLRLLFLLTFLNWLINTFFKNPMAKEVEPRLSKEEVEVVMGRIGMLLSVEEEEEEMGFEEELCDLFEEEGPTLEEVRESFYVFDENNDGFIDALELKRVLDRLELHEGVSLEDCERMIGAHDENRDGLIDYNEFVKLMETSFS